MTDLAVGAVTVMASGALVTGLKLLMDVVGTGNKRFSEEIARVEQRHESERAEWAIERAELRARIRQLEGG